MRARYHGPEPSPMVMKEESRNTIPPPQHLRIHVQQSQHSGHGILWVQHLSTKRGFGGFFSHSRERKYRRQELFRIHCPGLLGLLHPTDAIPIRAIPPCSAPQPCGPPSPPKWPAHSPARHPTCMWVGVAPSQAIVGIKLPSLLHSRPPPLKRGAVEGPPSREQVCSSEAHFIQIHPRNRGLPNSPYCCLIAGVQG